MKNNKERILSVCEGAIMIALAFVLEMLFKWLNTIMGISALLPFGGSVTASVLPIIYYSYRRGPVFGLITGIAYSALQMVTGLSLPPAKTFLSLVLCILLDYVLAFAIYGIACVFAKPFCKKRVIGYAFGAFVTCVVRFISSTLSGALLWGEYAPEGMNVWVYSIVYNGSYMLVNTILTVMLICVICISVDPTTLRPMKKQ